MDHHRLFLDFIPAPKALGGNVWDFENTDYGRARFILEHFSDLLRYVPEHQCFRVWHGGWHTDTKDLRLQAYVCSLADWQSREASRQAAADRNALSQKYPTGAPPPEVAAVENEIKRRMASVKPLGTLRSICAALDLVRTHGPGCVPLPQWDADPWVVGTNNGVLNLKTREFHAGRPADYVTKRLHAVFDPKAECPHWEAFIAKVLPDKDVSDYVQQLVGYSMTGITSDQSFYFLHGNGRNGKSIFISVISKIMGDYAGKARKELIEEAKNTAYKTDLARLPGIRFLYGEETSSNGKLRDEVIKAITAGDTLTGEAKFQSPFDFQPVAKLWLMGNHKPRVEGTDEGIWRRVKLIPFTATISKEEEIPQAELMAMLLAETPGILNWALRGLDAFVPTRVPPEILEAVQEYRNGEDDLGDFLGDCVELIDYDEGTRKKDRPTKQQVYAAYSAWAESVGIRYPWSAKQLTRRLKERGIAMCPGKRTWPSIQLTVDNTLVL